MAITPTPSIHSPAIPSLPRHACQPSPSHHPPSPSRFSLSLLLTSSTLLTLWLLLDGSLRFPEQPFHLHTKNFHAPSFTLQSYFLIALEGTFACGSILYLLRFTRNLANPLHLRSLFAFTFLVACWVSLHLHWKQLVYAGRILRISSASHQIQAFAQDFDANWDRFTHRQSSPLQAPFNAYPTQAPSMLMLLHQLPIPNTRLTFMSIERSPNHTIRIELSGSNAGYWIELLPDPLSPSHFTGGLGEQHVLHSHYPISPHLWLTEYH